MIKEDGELFRSPYRLLKITMSKGFLYLFFSIILFAIRTVIHAVTKTSFSEGVLE